MASKKQLNEKDIGIGGYLFAQSAISFNEDRPVTRLKVKNTNDRPIQIGSHFHFFEVNPTLEFDRAAAFGKRLNITSTTAIRFEPGDEIEVELIPFGGKQTIYGFNDLVDAWVGISTTDGSLSAEQQAIVQRAIQERGFKNS